MSLLLKQRAIAAWLAVACILSLAACNSPANLETQTTPTLSTANPSPQVSGTPVRFGILVIDSAMSANERYAPLLRYLEEATGRPFELVPLTQDSQFGEVAAGNLDFMANNPLAAVQIRQLYKTDFLVTYSRPRTGTQFSGLIIVRRDSEIQTLEDLRDQKVACINFQKAAGGCVFQIDYLRQRGIDPFRDFSSFVENKSHDNIVLAVLNGTIDVGFIRTGQLEKMVENGSIENLDVVRVLAPADDDFWLEHTTALYPEWPVVALKETDRQLVQTVKTALLALPPHHPALKAAQLERFVPATDYSELEQLIERLQLKRGDARE